VCGEISSGVACQRRIGVNQATRILVVVSGSMFEIAAADLQSLDWATARAPAPTRTVGARVEADAIALDAGLAAEQLLGTPRRV
jgi:hypothetical protein